MECDRFPCEKLDLKGDAGRIASPVYFDFGSMMKHFSQMAKVHMRNELTFKIEIIIGCSGCLR